MTDSTIRSAVTQPRGQVLAAAASLLLLAVPGATRAAVPPGDACYALTLEKAVAVGPENGRDLRVALDVRGGKVAGAFGHAPTFNKMPAELDPSALAVANGRLTGTLEVSIAWDGWVPKDGKPFAADYTLDAAVADGRAEGKWTAAGPGPKEGAVKGVCAAPAPDAGLVRLTLACANAVDHGGKISSRGLKAVVALRDGKAVAVRAIPAGSIADVACAMEVPAFDLSLADGRLTGRFEVKITPQNVSAQHPVTVYAYQVRGVVIGDGAGGSLAVARDGVPLNETAVFTATARRGEPPPAGDCTFKITLHHALGQGKFIDVYLASTGGRFTGGFASSPNFNNAMHLVDASRLTLGDGKVAGELGVTVLADPWVPADHKPIPCSFTLDAAVANGEITGRFKGTTGGSPAEGSLEGALDDKVKLDNPAGLTIRLENGLAGSGNHMARAFVNINLKDGKIAGGSVGNNHDGRMKGAVTGGEFTVKGDQWTLRVEFTLEGAGSATLGKYTATAAGTFVGTMSAGAFTCTHEGGRAKEGSFWAAFRPQQ